VRDDLVAEWSADPERFRLRRFVRLDESDVAGVRCTLTKAALPDDPQLAGSSAARSEADTWTWEDGLPVAGSTPRRVLTHAVGLESSVFVAERADEPVHGLDAPRVSVELTLREGGTRTVVLGKRGAPRELAPPPDAPPGTPSRSVPQAYARTLDRPEVYLVDEGLLEVCRDMRREATRKAEGDAEKGARRDRIEKERGQEPQGAGAR
jgi:hypothetical protein